MDIVFLIFDRITALDAIGPYDVVSRLPGAQVRFVAPRAGTVRTDNGFLGLVADHAIADVDRADLLVVPGGWGTRALATDAEVLDWVRAIHATTTYTTSVCTGSIVLAAAGILEGLEATCHWAFADALAEHGAIPTRHRIVDTGKVITAAGVSAGIDMALHLVARIGGDALAQAIQLAIEYDPAPPFDAGSVDKAPPEVVAAVRATLAARFISS